MKNYTVVEFFYDLSFKDYETYAIKSAQHPGYVFAPYLILETRPIVVESFTTRRNLVTRYAINTLS